MTDKTTPPAAKAILELADPYVVIAGLKLLTDDPAAQAVAYIFRDLSDRSGIGDVLGNTDSDIVVDMIQDWYWFTRKTIGEAAAMAF